MKKEILDYIIVSVSMFTVFSGLGVVFDNWLIKTGRIQYSKRIMIIVVSFLLVFIKPLFLKDVSWWVYGLIHIVGLLSLNRSDLGESIKSGPWWWIKNKRNNKKKDT